MNGMVHCTLCGRDMPEHHAVHGQMIQGGVLELIRKRHPEWVPQSLLCTDCARRFGADYVQEALEKHAGELSALDQEVVQSLREHELVARNINTQFDGALSVSARLADQVAAVGGSWTFIVGFGVVLAGWIVVNSSAWASDHFDPYPYILLNLVLSCLAALQAPVIMMSQNRREMKDRLRAEEDYRVNLKAELQIRHLQTKIDQLLSRQWQRLLEIQHIQTAILEDIASRGVTVHAHEHGFIEK